MTACVALAIWSEHKSRDVHYLCVPIKSCFVNAHKQKNINGGVVLHIGHFVQLSMLEIKKLKCNNNIIIAPHVA